MFWFIMLGLGLLMAVTIRLQNRGSNGCSGSCTSYRNVGLCVQ